MPHLDMFIGNFGVPGHNKIESWHSNVRSPKAKIKKKKKKKIKNYEIGKLSKCIINKWQQAIQENCMTLDIHLSKYWKNVKYSIIPRIMIGKKNAKHQNAQT